MLGGIDFLLARGGGGAETRGEEGRGDICEDTIGEERTEWEGRGEEVRGDGKGRMGVGEERRDGRGEEGINIEINK